MDINQIETEYKRSQTLIKTNGVLSIVFGTLGIVFGLLLMIVMTLPEVYENEYDGLTAIVVAIIIFVTMVLPHVFLIISGTLLIKLPKVNLVRGLIITNLVIAAFWNLVILIFTIIALTQLGDYDRGYKLEHKEK